MNWSEPISSDTGFPDQLIPFWHWVLIWIEPCRADAIGGAEWTQAKDLIDSLRAPSPAEANARWREFVVAVWRLRERWVSRMQKRRAAVRRSV